MKYTAIRYGVIQGVSENSEPSHPPLKWNKPGMNTPSNISSTIIVNDIGIMREIRAIYHTMFTRSIIVKRTTLNQSDTNATDTTGM